jgi:hypothetical protein
MNSSRLGSPVDAGRAGCEVPAFFGAALTNARVLAAGKAVVPRAMAVRVREEVVEEDDPSQL